MAILAHDCTHVRILKVRIEPKTGLAIAANADGIHIASCRGHIEVVDNVVVSNGDDCLNVHSQYALVASVDVIKKDIVRVLVGPHQNTDKTLWASLFAKPVFRVGDIVNVRKATGLDVVISAAEIVDCVPQENQEYLTIDIKVTDIFRQHIIQEGDIVEPLSAVPSSASIANNTFASSRASGIILQTNNAHVDGNTIFNLSAVCCALISCCDNLWNNQ